MLIRDRVYDKEKINEPVLIELINSKIVQRLKGISQQGMPRRYYSRAVFSRFDHSIGVLVLLRRLGAGMEEQIAGLLHDISHTAFSHVIDVVLGDPLKEDYQDSIHLKVMKNSELPQLLASYGFDYTLIAKPESFSLLDRHAPSLCADRIDYTLRELESLGKVDVVKMCVANLDNIHGQIVFKTKKSAEYFARAYLGLQRDHWSGNEARARYFLLAQALKRALDSNLISKRDLMEADGHVMSILEHSKDKEILEKLHMLKFGFTIEESQDGLELKSKFRYVDPEVVTKKGIMNLTTISSRYKEELEKEKSKKDSFVKIKILK